MGDEAGGGFTEDAVGHCVPEETAEIQLGKTGEGGEGGKGGGCVQGNELGEFVVVDCVEGKGVVVLWDISSSSKR